MKGLWKDGKQSRKKKPWYNPPSWFKREQTQKRRAKERQAVRAGKDISKFSKEYWL